MRLGGSLILANMFSFLSIAQHYYININQWVLVKYYKDTEL